MRNIAIGLTALVAACATPADIYSSEIDLAETSAKPIDEISQCLQLRWGSAPITAPDGKLTFPMKNAYDQVLGLLTLSPVENGTRLELRKTGQMIFGGQDWRKCA